MGRLIPCTMVTEALLIHTRASYAAMSICSRAVSFSGSLYAVGRFAKIRFSADSAKVSVMGFAFLEV